MTASSVGGEDPAGRVSLVTRSFDGAFTVNLLVLTADGSIDGVPTWQDDGAFRLTRDEPAPPPGDFTPATAEPDLVARRAEDLVLLGVRWNDAVDVETGPPLELVAGSGAELTVTLPPQHVIEEVVRGKGDFTPPSPPELTGGVPVWRSSVAGPSQVVVALDERTRVPLTVEGVLTALRGGHVLPAADLTDPRTQLELPTGLLMTPFRDDGTNVVLDHPAGAVVGPGGTVGLWSSRVAASGVAPSDPAGLTMRPLAADVDDDFPTSLRGGSRARILAEAPTARIDRLSLSALGATFSAAGSWETFGVGPLRHHGPRPQSADRHAGGALSLRAPSGLRRVQRALHRGHESGCGRTSTQIVGADDQRAGEGSATVAVVPVHAVEMQRTLVELGGDPDFKTTSFPNPAADQVTADEMFLLVAMTNQLRQVIPQRGPGAPVVEDFAHLLVPTSDEQNQAADDYLVGWLSVKRNRAKAAALRAGASPQVDLFMVPSEGGRPIQFPIVLSGPSGQVHVEMPVVFVADLRLSEGLLRPAYQSLQDPDVHQRVADAYKGVGDGDVLVPPVRVDMVGAAESQPADAPEVRRLHIVGAPSGDGYAPRLGAAPVAGETQPAADRWAFEMAMTEIATLVDQPGGADTQPARRAEPGAAERGSRSGSAVRRTFGGRCPQGGVLTQLGALRGARGAGPQGRRGLPLAGASAGGDVPRPGAARRPGPRQVPGRRRQPDGLQAGRPRRREQGRRHPPDPVRRPAGAATQGDDALGATCP